MVEVLVKSIRCRYCDSDIIFTVTPHPKLGSKWIPVNAEDFDSQIAEYDIDGKPIFNDKLHTRHYSSCKR